MKKKQENKSNSSAQHSASYYQYKLNKALETARKEDSSVNKPNIVPNKSVPPRKSTIAKPSHRTEYNRSTEFSSNKKTSKVHIIIDPVAGNYTLLDSNLRFVDSMHSNPLFSFFTQHHNLKKFKKQLKNDFKLYKKYCKQTNKSLNPDFKEMFSLTKYYLKLCPDADYQILELLRKNITRINPSYANYQTACAEYLYELAQLRDGDPSKLPFDINFCCDKICSDHSYISYRFDPAPDPVQRFRTIYTRQHNLQNEFQSGIRCNASIPNTKFSKVRTVRTTNSRDR